MRTAMLLVAAGQATVTVAAAWELLADWRRPPRQRRRPRYLLAFIGVTTVLVAVASAAAFLLGGWEGSLMADLGGRTGSPPGGGGVIVDRVP